MKNVTNIQEVVSVVRGETSEYLREHCMQVRNNCKSLSTLTAGNKQSLRKSQLETNDNTDKTEFIQFQLLFVMLTTLCACNPR